jgi:alcohol dehydrogenase, propanol-preferring
MGNADESDPVGLAWLHDSCGECEYCRTGWDALCLAQHNSGYSVNGSFAEYAIGSAAYVARLPPNPDFVAMAPILCAGVTTYKGIKETEVRPGEWIAIRIQASLHRSAISSTASGPPRASAYAEKPAHELASLGAS